MNKENKNNGQYPADEGNYRKRKKPNILSRIFIWWICPVLINGNRREVEEEDLIIPSKVYDSEKQGEYFER